MLLCGPVRADPSAEYYRACAHASYNYAASVPSLITRAEFNERLWEGRDRAKVSCAAFIDRLAALTDPTLEERLALVNARSWIGEDVEDYRTEVMRLANALPEDNADALLIRSVYDAEGEESLALLLRSLEADPHHPRHRSGLQSLFWKSSFNVVDSKTLLRHWNTDYETVAQTPHEKASAAALIYTTALEAGKRETAEAIRVRVRHDLGLDSLDFEHREAALELVCDEAMLVLNFESLCTGAFERLAAESADVGSPLPGDILRPLERTIHLISERQTPRLGLGWGGGGGEEEREAVRRLGVVLDAYPDHLRSPEHRRVYAEGFLEGAVRTEALREVVATDPGNVAAHCGLARSLEKDSPDEAWSVYANLASAFDARSIQCDPHESMQRIEEWAEHGTKLQCCDIDVIIHSP